MDDFVPIALVATGCILLIGFVILINTGQRSKRSGRGIGNFFEAIGDVLDGFW